MAVFDGTRQPDGLLAITQAATGQSASSVDVKKKAVMLQIDVLVAAGTPTATVALFRRNSPLAPAAVPPPANLPDVGFVQTPDAPLSLTAAVPGGQFRVLYPIGQYAINVTALGAGANVSASYSVMALER